MEPLVTFTLSEFIVINILESVLILEGKISKPLYHLVGCLSLGQLLALACPSLRVLPLDDTVDGEHPLVRETLLVVQLVHRRRPPPGHTHLLQCTNGVSLYSVVVRREDFRGQIRNGRLTHVSIARVLSSLQFVQDGLQCNGGNYQSSDKSPVPPWLQSVWLSSYSDHNL